MRSAALILSLTALCSCRLGEPSQLVLSNGEPVSGAGSDAGASGGAGGSAGATSGAGALAGQGASGENGGGSAGGPGGSAGGDDAEADADADVPSDGDASVTGEPGASCAPEVQVCDPVANVGCPEPMQCAVDLASDVLAGYCVFNGPVDVGCFNSGVTESCPPKSTCLDFECRTLCFCDADCEAGQCCVDPVGGLGFKACGAC